MAAWSAGASLCSAARTRVWVIVSMLSLTVAAGMARMLRPARRRRLANAQACDAGGQRPGRHAAA
jgi:hypothetical protein